MKTPLDHAELKKKMGLHPSVRLIISPASTGSRERVAQKFASLREKTKATNEQEVDVKQARVNKTPLELLRQAKKNLAQK